MFLAPTKLDPNEKSFAKQWEHSALKYQPYFEVKKVQAAANINTIRQHALLNWDPILKRGRYS